MTYDLVSIGSITKDIFLSTDRGEIFKTPKDKLAPEWLGFELGEKICVDEISENIGGVASGLAIGTKKLGLKSASLGTIGRDGTGEWILNEMKEFKIDTSCVVVDPKRKSAISIILVDQKTGERVIFYEKSSGAINLSALKRAKTKWLSVSSLTGNWSKEANDILAYIKQYNARLILAPSTSMIRDGYKNLKKLFKNAEMVFLNRNEAIEIAFNEKTRASGVNNLIKILHKLGPKIICLTDGAKGAYCSDGKRVCYSPIKKVKTVDVTGAGDAFASGFLGIYLKGASIEKSLKMGISNSANVVKYIGTTRGLLTK
ncbi:MAG: carbohydrate kinase family protein [Patescibacteria group bacterium]|nr:carbohydrate kinase family protein [Patescibacteria group bacterium]